MEITFTEEEYLTNRTKKRYHKDIVCFFPGKTLTFHELIKKLTEAEKELSEKDEVDIWCDGSEYEEEQKCTLVTSWIDWETKEDFKKRMYENKWAKERAVESLKRLITKNPQEAVEILKDLKLI